MVAEEPACSHLYLAWNLLRGMKLRSGHGTSAPVGEALIARQMANLFQRKISGVVKSLCECAEIKTANEQSVHQRTGC